MKGRVLTIVCVLVLSASSQLGAQIFSAPQHERKLTDRFVGGLSFLGGFPVGEFRQHEDGGVGGTLSFGYQPMSDVALFIRADGGSLMYGSAQRTVRQPVCDMFGCYEQEVRYNARSHSMSFFQIGPEMSTSSGRWRPFLNAMVGWTMFSSSATLRPRYYYEDSAPSVSLFRASNFSSGYGAGLRRVTGTTGRPGGWEFGLRLTRNMNAEYLTEEGVHQRSDGVWEVSPRSGAAHVLSVHIGGWIGPRVGW